MDLEMTPDKTVKRLPVRISFLVRCHHSEVLEIEKQCFGDYGWDAVTLTQQMRHRSCVGLAASYQEKVVGFLIYTLEKSKLEITDVAVHEDWRYKGVGKALIDCVFAKLYTPRDYLQVHVRETNLDAQLFFKKMGFFCEDVAKGYYHEVPDDAYVMRRKIIKGRDADDG